MSRQARLAALLVFSFGLSAVYYVSGRAEPDGTTTRTGADWPEHGQSGGELHYSPLAQISTENVGRLGLAWALDLNGEHSLEGIPVAVDGTLFFSGQSSKVYAVAAASGKLLWSYDPETWRYRPQAMKYMYRVNRGVAYANGRVFVATLDGRLIALDARTGKAAWSVMTVAENSLMNITGAPRVFKGKVVIGQSGGDYGERGYLTAYDQASGKQVWRFYTAPGAPGTDEGVNKDAMAMAAATWKGEYWKTGTGGTVWNAVTFDEELDRVYIGTGNSGPYNPDLRSPGDGDNLFLASIVAVEADTGKYIWSYQVNPREAWDYKATTNMIPATLEIDGKPRKVLMQAPTNGFFYVLDRETGKLISAEKYGKVNWAERIDVATGRPVEMPGIRYKQGPVTMYPGPLGAHNWQPMSYNPKTGLVYIPYMQLPGRFEASDHPAFGIGTSFEFVKEGPDDATGALVAWDPVMQKQAWRVPYADMWNGGTMTTAGGLVFQGDQNGIFHAYDARSGKELWKFDTKLGIIAAPMTYQAGGRQYISLLVGFGGATILQTKYLKSGWKYNAQPRRLFTFALDANQKLPDTPPRNFQVRPVYDATATIDEALAARGARLYNQNSCLLCHGLEARGSGVPGPDLRESAIAANRAAFDRVLKQGIAELGMPEFSQLPDADIAALYMYVRTTAREAAGGASAPRAEGAPARN